MQTPRTSIPLLFLALLAIHHIHAQGTTINVTPLLACTVLTFSCPGVSGCCTIGGCCGKGCCANGYTCINEGTVEEACCPAFDGTKCGSAPSPTPSTSNSASGQNTCTQIHNCPRDPVRGLAWTCLLGKTCGLSYPDCNPCPYIAAGGSGSSVTSSFESSPTSSSTEESSSPSTTLEETSTPTSSSEVNSNVESATSSSGAGVSPTTISNPPTSLGCRTTEHSGSIYFLAVVILGLVVMGFQ